MSRHGDIGDISRCGDHTVGQSGHGIDTNMGTHLRVALFGLVLGERRRQAGGVNDSVSSHEQPLFGQTGVDLLEDPLGQEVIR